MQSIYHLFIQRINLLALFVPTSLGCMFPSVYSNRFVAENSLNIDMFHVQIQYVQKKRVQKKAWKVFRQHCNLCITPIRVCILSWHPWDPSVKWFLNPPVYFMWQITIWCRCLYKEVKPHQAAHVVCWCNSFAVCHFLTVNPTGAVSLLNMWHTHTHTHTHTHAHKLTDLFMSTSVVKTRWTWTQWYDYLMNQSLPGVFSPYLYLFFPV